MQPASFSTNPAAAVDTPFERQITLWTKLARVTRYPDDVKYLTLLKDILMQELRNYPGAMAKAKTYTKKGGSAPSPLEEILCVASILAPLVAILKATGASDVTEEAMVKVFEADLNGLLAQQMLGAVEATAFSE